MTRARNERTDYARASVTGRSYPILPLSPFSLSLTLLGGTTLSSRFLFYEPARARCPFLRGRRKNGFGSASPRAYVALFSPLSLSGSSPFYLVYIYAAAEFFHTSPDPLFFHFVLRVSRDVSLTLAPSLPSAYKKIRGRRRPAHANVAATFFFSPPPQAILFRLCARERAACD